MFRERSKESEIMDDLLCEGPVVEQTLRELDKINLLLGGNNVSLSALEKCLESADRTKPMHIADLGCGSGDLLRIIAKNAIRNKRRLKLTGIDANPFIINYAIRSSREFPEIDFKYQNIFSQEFYDQKFDVVNCTLFCHHFNDSDLVALLKNLSRQTSAAIIINDIHRHWFSYYSIKWLTFFFSSSSMVKNDASLSVLKAFRRNELEKLIRKAGFSNFSIEWKWAFRYQVIIWLNK